MISHAFKRLFSLLVFAFWFWSVQGLAAQEINYKLVPNLQQLNASSATPDFTLPDQAGKKVSLKDFRGKLVMLNFWASWCEPCREEMPTMERLYQEFKNKGFVILGVDVKDRKKDAVAFIKELKLTYPVVFDPNEEVGLLYGVWALPTTYLIGPKGQGLARLWGPAHWYSPGARQLIKALRDEKKK
jgi:cytochrome c biogenesis protein CcmG/thiol:disulfide interchange protein DsbE